jgi:hypothetical protein
MEHGADMRHEGIYGYGIGAWSMEHGRAENRELESRAHRRRSDWREEQRAERIERESEIQRARSREEAEVKQRKLLGYHAERKVYRL